MTFTRVLAWIGRVLVTLGLVLLLFTAYQIWGTALTQSHTQASLRQQFEKELRDKKALEPKKVTRLGPPVVAAATSQPTDGSPIAILQIPSIGLDQVVVQGTSTQDLMKGPGHYPSTPLPGQAGNSAIAGHRTTWGHPFYDLNNVKRGARVLVATIEGRFVYSTTKVSVIAPTDNSVLDPTTVPSLTLTTCNPPYSAAQRLVLRAKLIGTELTGLAGNNVPASGGGQVAGSSGNDWLRVILLGLATLAVGVLFWLVGRRYRHRWLVYLSGVPFVLVVMYFFFQSISPLLPPTF